MGNRYTKKTFVLEIIGIVIGLIFLIPFYFVLINSVKPFAAILIDAAAWPKEFLFSNYAKVWNIINFPRAFWNSLVITVFSNIGLVVISSMAAWKMVRTPGKFSKILFVFFVSAMVIPFPDGDDSPYEAWWNIRFDEQHPRVNHHVFWIWCSTFLVPLSRVCQNGANRDRGIGHDRWLQPVRCILEDRIPAP